MARSLATRGGVRRQRRRLRAHSRAAEIVIVLPHMSNDRRKLGPIGFYVTFALVALVFFLFPASLRLVEGAARQLRYVWWLILLLGLLLWVLYKLRPKK